MDWAHISGLFPRVIGDVISAAFSRTWISDFFSTFLQTMFFGTTGSTSDVVIETGVSASWTPFFRITAGGELQWLNPATGVKDTNLYRESAGKLQTNYSFSVQNYLYIGSTCSLYEAGSGYLATNQNLVVGDVSYNIALPYDQPAIFFGNRSDAWDTTLYRASANVLRTDDAFIINNNLTTYGTTIIMYNLPTSDPHVNGQLWRDGTDLKVSIG